jgi:hypothetical protein
MLDGGTEFERLVGAVLTRWLGQNGRSSFDPAAIAGFAHRLWLVVRERGLPLPLPAGECGAPGGMPEGECSQLVARVVGSSSDSFLLDAARQLVKTCFYPEFRNCRDSFRETSSDGICRRQQLQRARGRISGSHCVDCPHWVSLSADEHEKFLAAEWRTDGLEFFSHRDIFLPEDFRALRQWLYAKSRMR